MRSQPSRKAYSTFQITITNTNDVTVSHVEICKDQIVLELAQWEVDTASAAKDAAELLKTEAEAGGTATDAEIAAAKEAIEKAGKDLAEAETSFKAVRKQTDWRQGIY